MRFAHRERPPRDLVRVARAASRGRGHGARAATTTRPGDARASSPIDVASRRATTFRTVVHKALSGGSPGLGIPAKARVGARACSGFGRWGAARDVVARIAGSLGSPGASLRADGLVPTLFPRLARAREPAPCSRRGAGPMTPPALTVEASLLLDTNATARQLGVRDRSASDRRLLYTAPDAYVELRIPPTRVFDGEAPWLYGQVVGTRDGATRGRAATVTMTIESGEES